MGDGTMETERHDAPVKANASELADEADRWTHDLGTALAAGILSGRFFRASSPEDGNGSTTTSGRTSDGGHDGRSEAR
jgi:hypothetical protein